MVRFLPADRHRHGAGSGRLAAREMTTPVIHAAAPETRKATECPTSSDANQHITDALGTQDAGQDPGDEGDSDSDQAS